MLSDFDQPRIAEPVIQQYLQQVEQLGVVALGLNASVVGSVMQAQWTDLDGSAFESGVFDK